MDRFWSFVQALPFKQGVSQLCQKQSGPSTGEALADRIELPLPSVASPRCMTGLPRQDQRGTDLANHLRATRLAPEKSIPQVGQGKRASALACLR